MSGLSATLRALLAGGTGAILVRVAQALGSTPREAGAAMIVTRDTAEGTVGGGALERLGIERARAMLGAGLAEDRLAVPLGPRIGQCCGGHVTLELARVDAALVAREAEREARALRQRPTVLVFGAGHTGRALARALAPLPIRTVLVDTRPDRLDALPPEIEARAVVLPEAEVAAAPGGTAFAVMTHDHGLDFLIAAAALARGDAAYVGMIGSATKREKFRRHLAEAGLASLAAGLTLPIGGGAVRDKRPEVIAALTAAELVTVLFSQAEENLPIPLAGEASQCNTEPMDPAPPEGLNARAS